MSKWIEPIYDRTALDITNRTPKAFFNILDWARIYGNTQQVQAVINIMLALDIPVTDLSAPSILTIPTADDINALAANIERLRAAAALPTAAGVSVIKTDWKSGSGADAPDFNTVNDWERDLALIRSLTATAAEQALYCGAFDCGAPWMIAHSFQPWRGYVPNANDLRRVPRLSTVAGAGLTRQNRWRSLVNHHKQTPRSNVAACGASLIRQNSWRKY